MYQKKIVTMPDLWEPLIQWVKEHIFQDRQLAIKGRDPVCNKHQTAH